MPYRAVFLFESVQTDQALFQCAQRALYPGVKHTEREANIRLHLVLTLRMSGTIQLISTRLHIVNKDSLAIDVYFTCLPKYTKP